MNVHNYHSELQRLSEVQRCASGSCSTAAAGRVAACVCPALSPLCLLLCARGQSSGNLIVELLLARSEPPLVCGNLNARRDREKQLLACVNAAELAIAAPRMLPKRLSDIDRASDGAPFAHAFLQTKPLLFAASERSRRPIVLDCTSCFCEKQKQL